MVEQGDYGPVLILRGRYQGKVGYYDDDDDGEVLSNHRARFAPLLELKLSER